jgi:hypothetical protein
LTSGNFSVGTNQSEGLETDKERQANAITSDIKSEFYSNLHKPARREFGGPMHSHDRVLSLE